MAAHLGALALRAARAALAGTEECTPGGEPQAQPQSQAVRLRVLMPPQGPHYLRKRLLPAHAPPEVHHWALHPWADEQAVMRVGAQSSGAAHPWRPSSQRSSGRLLFALRPKELAQALGDATMRQWMERGQLMLPVRASLALSAAQWRLEGFRPTCRPSHVTRASGEVPLPLSETTETARPS